MYSQKRSFKIEKVEKGKSTQAGVGDFIEKKRERAAAQSLKAVKGSLISSPLRKRSMDKQEISTEGFLPRSKSAITCPTAGLCWNPWPLNPLARKKPFSPGDSPRMA